MTDARQPPTVALRIDVDFSVGLTRAVPRMLDTLRDAGMRATLLVVAGGNAPRRSLARLRQPGYLRRLRGLGPLRVARGLGGSLWTGGAMLRSAQARSVVQRILADGHELAVHGYDHAWWADNIWRMPFDRARAEIDRAYETLQDVVGADAARAWASPNWRTTDAVMRYLSERGVGWLSECWGAGPFRTVDALGVVFGPPHLPVTLPSAEAVMLERGLDPDAAADHIVAAGRDGAVEVACVHDYFEGLMYPRLFERLVGGWAERGVRAGCLGEVAQGLVATQVSLVSERVGRGAVPGFTGEVSLCEDRGTQAPWHVTPIQSALTGRR